MHAGELSLLACGISIILQYMNDNRGEDPERWTLKAARCETFEEISAGCKSVAILAQVGFGFKWVRVVWGGFVWTHPAGAE